MKRERGGEESERGNVKGGGEGREARPAVAFKNNNANEIIHKILINLYDR